MAKMQLRAMSIAPGSIDATLRTVEVIWTTGAAVKRMDRLGEYEEVLAVTDEAVDLERLRNGAPVLNAHQSWSAEDQIGVVEDAWISFNKGFARLRFSEREAVEPLWKDIQAGIIRNLSVGYTVEETDSVTDAEGNRTVTATRWTPYEISVVPIPADAGSQFRALDLDEGEEIAVEPEVEEAPQDPETPAVEDAPEETPPAAAGDAPADEDPSPALGAETESESDDGVPAGEKPDAAPKEEAPAPVGERSISAMIVRAALRHGVPEMAATLIEEGLDAEAAEARLSGVSEIRSLCKRFKVDPTPHMGQSIDAVRAAILERLAAEDAEVETRFASDSTVPEKPKATRSALNPADIYARYRG